MLRGYFSAVILALAFFSTNAFAALGNPSQMDRQVVPGHVTTPFSAYINILFLPLDSSRYDVSSEIAKVEVFEGSTLRATGTRTSKGAAWSWGSGLSINTSSKPGWFHYNKLVSTSSYVPNNNYVHSVKFTSFKGATYTTPSFDVYAPRQELVAPTGLSVTTTATSATIKWTSTLSSTYKNATTPQSYYKVRFDRYDPAFNAWGNSVITDAASGTLTQTLTAGKWRYSVSGCWRYSNANYDGTLVSFGTNCNAAITAGTEFTIIGAPPAIAYTNPVTFISYQTKTVTPSNTGGSITSCVLKNSSGAVAAVPAGLTLSQTTCALSGANTANQASTSYTVTPTGPGGTGAAAPLTLVLKGPPVITYAGNTSTNPYVFVVGTAARLVATNTGAAVYNCTIKNAAGNEPTNPTTNGMYIDRANCDLYVLATNTTVLAQTTFSVTASSADAVTSTPTTVHIKINPTPPNMTYPASSSTSPIVFTVGTAKTVTATNSGGLSTGCVLKNSAGTVVSPPAGLTLDINCKLSGTPTSALATTYYTATASNAGGSDTPEGIYIQVGTLLVPALTYGANKLTFYEGGQAYTAMPTNTGGVPTSCSINAALPAGLSLIATGTNVCGISGTLTGTVNFSSTNYTVTATNAAGSSTSTFALETYPKPVIHYADSPIVFTVGAASKAVSVIVDKGINLAGANTINKCTISPALPSGLYFNSSTFCGITSNSSLLTAAMAATTYTVTASNIAGSGTTTATIRIDGPAAPVVAKPVISYAPSPVVHMVGTASARAVTNTGGAITGCTISPALPTGLSIDSGCSINSTSSNVETALANYTVTATNAGGSTAITVGVQVKQWPPSVSYSPSALVFTSGTAKVISATLSGGPVGTCSISPALPTGLSLNSSNCQISALSSAPANTQSSHTVTVSNSGGSGTTSITVKVDPAPVIPPSVSYSPSALVFTSGTASTISAALSGGPMGTCSISPALPSGLSLNTSNCAISALSSAPASAQSSYTVTVSNSGGSNTAAITIKVDPAPIPKPAISYTTSYIFKRAVAITSFSPSNSGGAISTCTITPSLPSGLTMSASTCLISGTPTVMKASTVYTVTASNSGGSSSASFTLEVQGASCSLSGWKVFSTQYCTPYSGQTNLQGVPSSGTAVCGSDYTTGTPYVGSVNCNDGVLSGITCSGSLASPYMSTCP